MLVFRLGDGLLSDERLEAVEVRLRPVEGRLRVEDVRQADGVERLARDEAEARFGLRRVGVGLPEGCVRLCSGNPDQDGVRRDPRAALHRRPDHPSADLGGNAGLLVGGQRAGDSQETIDRSAFDRRDPNGHGRRLRRRGGAGALAAACGGEQGRERGAGEKRYLYGTNHDCRSSLSEGVDTNESSFVIPAPARRPRNAVSSVRGGGVWGVSPWGGRSHSFNVAAPCSDVSTMRKTACGSVPAGNAPESMACWIRRTMAPRISTTKPNRFQFLLILGTLRSRNISAKYSGCSLQNS